MGGCFSLVSRLWRNMNPSSAGSDIESAAAPMEIRERQVKFMSPYNPKPATNNPKPPTSNANS